MNVAHPNGRGVKQMMRCALERWASVEEITEQRVAYGSQMDADLMASSMVGAHLDEAASRRGTARQDLGSCSLGAEALDLAWVGAGANLSTIARIVRDRRIDDPRRLDLTGTARQVSFLDATRSKLLAKLGERALGSCCEHHAGGSGV